MEIEFIDGGVCAAKGFLASGMHAGLRKNKDKKDLALIFSESDANCAALFTQNLVKGAPLLVTKENIKDGHARAIIANSQNANTCNADGIEKAKEMCKIAGEALSLAPSDIVVASTGVIGQPLDITPIKEGAKKLASMLNHDGSSDANNAIMTTDTKEKNAAVKFFVGGKECKLGAIAKGSGMIHPNLATMLVFVTTDCAISSKMLQKALCSDVKKTFNMVSVDGDTSTNDMVVILANGEAENEEITAEGDDFEMFMKALNTVTMALCRKIAGDGEGATKLLEVEVCGAKNEEMAKNVAKSVATSSLFKAAMFGSDANWGRVLCAIGYSGEMVDVTKIDVSFESVAGEIAVCKNGMGIPFSEEIAKEILSEEEITTKINLNLGDMAAMAWGCDLTYDYVKINGDYRT